MLLGSPLIPGFFDDDEDIGLIVLLGVVDLRGLEGFLTVAFLYFAPNLMEILEISCIGDKCIEQCLFVDVVADRIVTSYGTQIHLQA